MTQPQKNRREPRQNLPDQASYEEAILWIRLSTRLDPGGEATGVLLHRRNDGNFTDTTVNVTLHDRYDRLVGQTNQDYGQNFGLPGEPIKCRWVRDNKVEPVGSQGLKRYGKPRAVIAAGTVGEIDVHYDSGKTPASCFHEPTGHRIVACNKSGRQITPQDEVICFYFPAMNSWFCVVVGGSVTGLICYKSTSDRTREQTAGQPPKLFGRKSAVIEDKFGSIPDVVGDTIEVRCCERLYLGEVEGCFGLAVPAGFTVTQGQTQVPVYIAIDSIEQAAYVYAETLADRSTHAPDALAPQQTVTCKLISHHGFANAIYPPGTVNPQTGDTEVDVVFPEGWYEHMQEGAVVKAYLDVQYLQTANFQETGTGKGHLRYTIDVSDQMSPQISWEQNDPICGGDTVTLQDGEFEACCFFPHSQVPKGPIEVFNPYNRATQSGECKAEWNDAPDRQRWELIEVPQVEETVLLPPDPQAQDPCAFRQRTVWLDSCEAPTVSTITAEENLTDMRYVAGEVSASGDCVDGEVQGKYQKVYTCGDGEWKKIPGVNIKGTIVDKQVFFDGQCIGQTQICIQVWDAGDSFVGPDVLCGREYVCPPGSGS